VKAQPHRSSKYFETVCCAGVGRDGKWRRQYPVPFRILDNSQKFGRWSWISYDFTTTLDDRRAESQKVVPESLKVGGKVKVSERVKFLNPLVRNSFEDANERGESLTLLRPRKIVLKGKRKSSSEIADERTKHAALAKQLSFLDKTAKPLEPCPVQFTAKWTDIDGHNHNHECDDWETSSAYSRFEHQYGHKRAIEIIRDKYENQYFKAGLALAFSTHSRRNVTYGTSNQWLLVGLIRLDESSQGDLLLG
jgi:hypothetical protein